MNWDERERRQNEALARLNDEFNSNLYMRNSACPTSVDGDVDGYAVDFRARWRMWAIQIGNDFERSGHPLERSGTAASWLSPHEMESILRDALSQWRARRDGSQA